MENDTQRGVLPAESFFIEPLDVLVFRGNKLFGAPGSFGENQMPPWPSVVAGALRTHMLDLAGVSLSDFMAQSGSEKGSYASDEIVESLGTVAHPGRFAVTWFSLGRRTNSGTIERLFPLPHDLFIIKDGKEKRKIVPVVPIGPDDLRGVATNAVLPWLPSLLLSSQSKGESGFFLGEEGFLDYLAGRIPDPSALVHQSELWGIDPRVGIGLDVSSRTASEGRLFSSETIALKSGVGFVVDVVGASGLIAKKALLRFGGDGRAAHMEKIESFKRKGASLSKGNRFRLVMTTPGIFSHGPYPVSPEGPAPLVDGGPVVRLLSASVGRSQTVSGWDLARRVPKAAQKAVPVGSVYWFQVVEGDPSRLNDDASAAGASFLEGLSRDRVSEGYNRGLITPWLS